MEIGILVSGECMLIPKPLFACSFCKEAREKGPPDQRTGYSAFIPDENPLMTMFPGLRSIDIKRRWP
jgi:hypothetical protein